jgi:Rrf2 family transcriptional regulator, cysteine metabolism repressor
MWYGLPTVRRGSAEKGVGMKLSTRARYGLRAMVDLAEHGGDGAPLMMRAIAEQQGLSKRYLDNIFATLRQAGLVRSVRGASGGYRLACEADDIRVDQVVEALEGNLELVHCEEHAKDCTRYRRCATSEVWHAASVALRDSLSSMTLADLVKRQAELDVAAEADSES